MRNIVSLLMIASAAFAADLPIHEVILYKHGVGFFERAGKLEAGDTARIDFKAEDMNDVLKSLTITDRSGGKISGVRYDASEPLEERLKNFPFAVGADSTLAAFLDQMKGARVELKFGSETFAGVIVSSRVIKGGEKEAEHETVTLLTDTGELRTFDLAGASSVKFTDAKLQSLLKDYLAVLNGARSKDRRSVYIDSIGAAARDLIASYMTPSPVWKSSYRLLFAGVAEPTLEGWAIVDNTSGDDWNSVRLSVVSGRPISFVTQLYAPKYVTRPGAELADNQAAAPTVFDGPINGRLGTGAAPMAMARKAAPGSAGGIIGGIPSSSNGAFLKDGEPLGERASVSYSNIASTAEGRDAGDLFEYSFSSPVTVKKGESAMLPFLQQKVGARKLLIYRETFGVNPQNAAEVTNSTGKTLDGGPITVYDAGSYAGEALVETVKAGDKRLISYGVDLGTRITTKFDSSRNVVREIHAYHGNLTSKYAMEEVRTFTIKNVDPKAKTLIIEHPQRQGYKLLEPAKASETTANANRFEVKLAASAADTFVLREERVYDQTVSVTNMTPDTISVWLENKVLSAAGRRQLEQIAAKKRDIANNDGELKQADNSINDLTQDQTRVRANIQSLNNVRNQQDLVQQYATQLAANETKMVALRDTQSELKRKKTALESELAALMEKLDF